MLARQLLATESSSDRQQTFSGYYTPETQLRVANLTTPAGRLTLGYRVDVLLAPGSTATVVVCRLVDTSGRLQQFVGSETRASVGSWQQLAFEASFDVPELTLAIRCSPDRAGVSTIVFRDAELVAVEP